MKAKPTGNWRLPGARLEWSKDKIYPVIPAINQLDWKSRGKVFMAHDPEDTKVEGAAILLERGEYKIWDGE